MQVQQQEEKQSQDLDSVVDKLQWQLAQQLLELDMPNFQSLEQDDHQLDFVNEQAHQADEHWRVEEPFVQGAEEAEVTAGDAKLQQQQDEQLHEQKERTVQLQGLTQLKLEMGQLRRQTLERLQSREQQQEQLQDQCAASSFQWLCEEKRDDGISVDSKGACSESSSGEDDRPKTK